MSPRERSLGRVGRDLAGSDLSIATPTPEWAITGLTQIIAEHEQAENIAEDRNRAESG